MVNLRGLIKFGDRLGDSLSSRRKELRSEVEGLTQKLRGSRPVRDEPKTSPPGEVRHVAPDEDGSGTVDDPPVDNDSNGSSSDDFVSAASSTRPAPPVAVSDATARQDGGQFRDSEGECQSAGHCSIDSGASDSVYDWVDVSSEGEESGLDEPAENTGESESSDSDDPSEVSPLPVEDWLQSTALCLPEQDVMSEGEEEFVPETGDEEGEEEDDGEEFLGFD